MATQQPPKKNTAFTFELPVFNYSGKYLSGATFSEYKVSKDGGTFTTLATAPTEVGSTGEYTIALSAAEMNADRIKLKFVVTGAPDISVGPIFTSARQIDDLAFPNVSGSGIDVEGTGEVAVNLDNIKQASAPTTLSNIRIPNVTLVDTTTDLTNQTALLAAIASAQSAVTAQTDIIKAKTNNLPTSPAATNDQMDLVNAPNATAILAIQSGIATQALLTTVSNKLGAITGSGRNTLLGYIQAIFRKDSDASVPTDINTDLGSGAGSANNTTDSLQAIRDQGDASWGGAGGGPTANEIADEVQTRTIAGVNVVDSVSGSVGSVVGSVGAVAGNVNGNVLGNVNGNVQGDIIGVVPNSVGTTSLVNLLTLGRAALLDNLAVLAGWSGTLKTAIQSLARKNVTSSDIGGNYIPNTDSLEAIRDQVDVLAGAPPLETNVSITELDE